MSLNRTILTVLTLTVFTLALTSPANAAGCKKVYSTLDTLVVEASVEVGQVDGIVEGAAYLRYDDTAPPIDVRRSSPNFVITSKLGTINLWVYSATNLSGGVAWWRNFELLRSEGTGIYAGQRFNLVIYGKCTLQGGHYEIEGTICPPLSPPKK